MCNKPINAYQHKGASSPLIFNQNKLKNDDNYKMIKIACGRCFSCRNLKIQNWIVRCNHEVKTSKYASYFVTLTYDNEHVPDNESLFYRHVQLFMKKLRKKYYKKYTKKVPEEDKIKYLCTGEYGEQGGRPHYHLLIFNINIDDLKKVGKYYASEWLAGIWENGNITIGLCESASISYTTSYTIKNSYTQKEFYKLFNLERGKLCCSKGIGKKYWQENIEELYKFDRTTYEIKKGVKSATLPKRYDEWTRKFIGEDYIKIIKEKREERAKIKKQSELDLKEEFLKKTWEQIRNKKTPF